MHTHPNKHTQTHIYLYTYIPFIWHTIVHIRPLLFCDVGRTLISCSPGHPSLYSVRARDYPLSAFPKWWKLISDANISGFVLLQSQCVGADDETFTVILLVWKSIIHHPIHTHISAYIRHVGHPRKLCTKYIYIYIYKYMYLDKYRQFSHTREEWHFTFCLSKKVFLQFNHSYQ